MEAVYIQLYVIKWELKLEISACLNYLFADGQILIANDETKILLINDIKPNYLSNPL